MSWVDSMRRRDFYNYLDELKTTYESASDEKERRRIISELADAVEKIRNGDPK